MVNGTTAKECGQRLRRIRMARNMSQQDLADILYTTPQNISKYEKDGINNIDVIMKINETLECNLLKDEMDVEGVIGEVGKEILSILIRQNGYIEVEHLISCFMYGLNEAQVTKEIVKLENIGLCVREQYTGLCDDSHDGLFITAKGIISLKNNLNPGLVSELFSNGYEDIMNDYNKDDIDYVIPDCLKTYEQIVISRGCDTYQDVLDQNELVRLVNKLPINIPYKFNFIWYLKNCHSQYEWLGKKKKASRLENELKEYGDFIIADSVYIDILHRMIIGLDNDLLGRILDSYSGNYDEKRFVSKIIRENLIMAYAPEFEEYRKIDPVIRNAMLCFAYYSEWYDEQIKGSELSFDRELLNDYVYDSLDKSVFSMEDSKQAKEYEQFRLEENKELNATCVGLDVYLEKIVSKKNSLHIEDWFEIKEIEEFINANFKVAETDKEREIDEQLKVIMTNYPEVLEYFDYPEEWEKCGLGKLIREKFL